MALRQYTCAAAITTCTRDVRLVLGDYACPAAMLKLSRRPLAVVIPHLAVAALQPHRVLLRGVSLSESVDAMACGKVIGINAAVALFTDVHSNTALAATATGWTGGAWSLVLCPHGVHSFACSAWDSWRHLCHESVPAWCSGGCARWRRRSGCAGQTMVCLSSGSSSGGQSPPCAQIFRSTSVPLSPRCRLSICSFVPLTLRR